MKINIIAAIGSNNEIGLDNKLLWKSKSDLEHFKKLTMGYPIIMGRKTFESLPGILPGRVHHVITSNAYALSKSNNNPYIKYSSSLEACLDWFEFDKVFIIGGESMYRQAISIAYELHITHMNWEGKADTYFPEINREEWDVKEIIPGESLGNNDEENIYSYYRYVRKKEIK